MSIIVLGTMPPERPLAGDKLAAQWVLVALLWIVTMAPEARSACPSTCECRWKGGKDTTECVERGLNSIPPGIDIATQVLDMTGNNLQSLPKEIFLRNGLTNLQKIFLINCKLSQIDKLAFSRLKNLVELDLSNNQLTSIPSDSLMDLGELRRLVLSGNPISTIASRAFGHLGSLIVLELSNCHLETVAKEAFGGLPGLHQLKLNGNRLRSLSMDVLQDIGSLHGIRLEENPWRCDCHCRDLRQWLTVSNVPQTVAPQCGEPLRLRGFNIDKLILEDFACAPEGVGPQQVALQAPQGGNVSMVCDIISDPEAFVHWQWQDSVITNATGIVFPELVDGGRTYLVEESGSQRKTSVLMLEALEERDAGQYICVAENRGGRHLMNFTLQVEPLATRGQPEPAVANRGVLLGAIIGLGVFALAALVLVCVLILRCCHSRRRRRHRRQKIPRSETQETKGSSTYDSQNDPLNEKLDLQPANPIQKPPRSFANATYVSTSEISLHDYSGSKHQSSERLMGGLGGAGGLGSTAEPQNGGVYSIKPDIIKMDNGEYSVPRGALVSPVTNGGATVPVDNGGVAVIYQNTGRWSNESPIATCHGCGDHSGSCLGVPCLHGYGHGGEVDAESDRSYRAANFRPTASGLAGEMSEYNAEEEWPRPPPPLYDTVKQPIAVQENRDRRPDDQYETVGYPVSGGGGQVWERQSPMAAAGVATVAVSFPGSSKQFAAGAAPSGAGASKHPNVHLKNSVSGLSPFPILNLSTVRDSPDEGYEDEGEEGTEISRTMKQKVKLKERRM